MVLIRRGKKESKLYKETLLVISFAWKFDEDPFEARKIRLYYNLSFCICTLVPLLIMKTNLTDGTYIRDLLI